MQPPMRGIGAQHFRQMEAFSNDLIYMHKYRTALRHLLLSGAPGFANVTLVTTRPIAASSDGPHAGQGASIPGPPDRRAILAGPCRGTRAAHVRPEVPHRGCTRALVASACASDQRAGVSGRRRGQDGSTT